MISDVLESADPTSGRITPSTSTPGTYTVTYHFTAPPTGCPNITTTTVVIDEPLNKTISTQAAAVCDGGGTNITVANVAASTSYQLRDAVTHNNIGGPVSGTAGSTVLLPTGTLVLANSPYTFEVLGITANNCTKLMSGTVSVTVAQHNTATTDHNLDFSNICSNSSFAISGASAGSPIPPNTTILWTTDGHGTITGSNTLTPTYNPTVADEGNIVTLTLTVTNGGICPPATDNIQIFIVAPPAITMSKTYICLGSSSQILTPTADVSLRSGSAATQA
jgi:hypothetical protein